MPIHEITIKDKTILPKGAWLVVALLFIVGALNYLDRTMITTMRNSIEDGIPMSDAQFGLLTSVFLWVYGLLSPFAGFLADRFNRSKVILGSLLVWSIVTWLTAHATNFEQLLATRALMGISEACYIPAALALIVDYHRGPTRSLATGIHIAGIMVGSSLGFLGGWIAEKHEWNLVFSIFGIIGIGYSVILFFVLHDAPSDHLDQTSEKQNNKVNFLNAIRDLFTRVSFILLLFFWGLIGVVNWMVVGWLPTYYKEHFDLTQSIAGFYATAYLYPASIAGLLLGGFWADRWSRKNSSARILVPIIGLCLAAPGIFIGSYTSILPLAISFFFLYGLTRTFTDSNLMPILCIIADQRYLATGYGVLNFFGTVVGGVGLYSAGVLRDRQVNLSRVYQFASLLILACILLLLLVKWYAKKNSRNAVRS